MKKNFKLPHMQKPQTGINSQSSTSLRGTKNYESKDMPKYFESKF